MIWKVEQSTVQHSKIASEKRPVTGAVFGLVMMLRHVTQLSGPRTPCRSPRGLPGQAACGVIGGRPAPWKSRAGRWNP